MKKYFAFYLNLFYRHSLNKKVIKPLSTQRCENTILLDGSFRIHECLLAGNGPK